MPPGSGASRRSTVPRVRSRRRASLVACVALAACGRVGFSSMPGDGGADGASLADAALGDGPGAACTAFPMAYQGTTTGHCYYLEAAQDPWTAGRDSCGAQAGGHVVALETAAERMEIEARTPVPHWIGLRDPDPTEGTYRWATGPVADTAGVWAPGEPDDDIQAGNEDCVWSVPGVGFGDRVCSYSGPIIPGRVCEIEPWQVAADGHRYQVLYVEVTQADADQRCAALGAHLATIGGQAEMDFIQSFTQGLELWIGLDDTATEGTFVWQTGEPLTYEYWEPGEPGAADTAENCVYKHMLGEWDDWECGRASWGALCEID